MLSHALFEFVLVFLAFLPETTAAATCYFPDGSVATGNVPCGDGTASCCGSVDQCLANGLCLVNSDPNTIEFARGACTDSTWSSPNCFQKCIATSSGTPMTNGYAVFECGATGYASPADYCCEKVAYGKDSCCSTPSLRFQLGAGVPVGKQGGSSTSKAQQQQPATTANAPGTTLQTQITVVTSIQVQSSSTKPQTTQTSTKADDEVLSTTSTSTTSSKSSLSSSGIATSSTSSGSATTASATATTSRSLSADSQSSGAISSPSADAVAVQTGPSDTAKIAIGVAVPIAVLIMALLGFLVWKNHRNQKRIQALDAQLNGAAVLSSSGTAQQPMVIPQHHIAELNNEKSGVSVTVAPAFTNQEYYKPNSQARRTLHELSGSGQMPSQAHHVELDSAPARRPEQFRRQY